LLRFALGPYASGSAGKRAGTSCLGSNADTFAEANINVKGKIPAAMGTQLKPILAGLEVIEPLSTLLNGS